MTTYESDNFTRLAQAIRDARQVVAFTGAGMSTESGIPDFRSPGGIWSQSQPVLFQDFLRDADARREYWRQKSVAHADFAAARPNVGHIALARWESAGYLRGVITQNIDGLHQDAGSQSVLELHGTARWVGCLACDSRFEPDPLVKQFLETNEVPSCPQCGGLLKHATVSFGQNLPEEVLAEAVAWTRDSDLFFAIGSSLVVEPAASLPRLAAQSGARLVIINRDPTNQDSSAEFLFHASIGETLAAVDQTLRAGG
jgi:NAD-dependent deacetylase